MRSFQKEMREAYFSGISGILVSGIVWLTAGAIGYFISIYASVIALFVGGMMIYPLSLLLDKANGRSAKHDKNNPLGILAIESTALLFIGLFIAFVIYQYDDKLFFPIMLLIIGSRYLIFQSIYGLRLYWVLGICLLIAGATFIYLSIPYYIPVIIGGLIEVIFSLIFYTKISN